MVALIVRLKWQLLRNGLRRSTPQLVGMVLSALYGLAVLAQGIVGLITLRLDQTSDVARIAITIGGSAVTLGWALLPVIAYGIDETLDPARFATFSIPRRQPVLGLLLSSLATRTAAAPPLRPLAPHAAWPPPPDQLRSAARGLWACGPLYAVGA